ncbi:hypothetical protein MHBO_000831 [Bonamia ostreae]|uniref:Uncharacterized protein n=1 Tax=Bonamia ostreae TaxID=126728 RepID=A0ABV2AGZ9_9EUKA
MEISGDDYVHKLPFKIERKGDFREGENSVFEEAQIKEDGKYETTYNGRELTGKIIKLNDNLKTKTFLVKENNFSASKKSLNLVNWDRDKDDFLMETSLGETINEYFDVIDILND